MKEKLLFLLLFLGAFFNSKAQQEPLLAAFHTQMNLVNPAFAGHKAGTEIGITSRNQWVSIENAPRGQFLTFSSERKNNIGLGISVISNKFFVEKSTSFAVDFSYKLNLANDSTVETAINDRAVALVNGGATQAARQVPAVPNFPAAGLQ